MLRRLNRQIVLLGVLNRDVTRQGKVTNRGNAVHVGRHRGNRDLEADLVVALTRATMCDRRRTELTRSLHKVLCNDGTRQRRHERVLAFVERVCLQSGHAVFGREFVARICNVRFNGSTIERTLTNNLKVLAALADVNSNSDDLAARLFTDPSDSDRGVQTA